METTSTAKGVRKLIAFPRRVREHFGEIVVVHLSGQVVGRD
jgi:hypothetical protein